MTADQSTRTTALVSTHIPGLSWVPVWKVCRESYVQLKPLQTPPYVLQFLTNAGNGLGVKPGGEGYRKQAPAIAEIPGCRAISLSGRCWLLECWSGHRSWVGSDTW
ncbi:hypothetical protein BaRGS_00021204 [Batillaria attramentaria]|uniref:Uncharacterized protein n=1 Tax=Batillaria attramentaria TaxID=370345 RepID=A0ABD0KK96_9CAEN